MKSKENNLQTQTLISLIIASFSEFYCYCSAVSLVLIFTDIKGTFF